MVAVYLLAWLLICAILWAWLLPAQAGRWVASAKIGYGRRMNE